LIQRNKLPVYLVYPSLRVGKGMLRMTLFDYVAIGVLIFLFVRMQQPEDREALERLTQIWEKLADVRARHPELAA
jgi:hypothetical protein